VEFTITIIGAGVIGLAVARELAKTYSGVLLLERNPRFGQETSSRNSEVIHRGIHYPASFLKSSLCMEGNVLLYEICRQRDIPHARPGKLIVACDAEEEAALNALLDKARAKGIDDLSWMGRKEITAMEPEVSVRAALFSPATGIIDSHALMQSFLAEAQAAGAAVSFHADVTGIEREDGAFCCTVNGGEYRLRTEVLVNSAGLGAPRIAAMAGIDCAARRYDLKYCKGNYFVASPAPRISRLVYPVPCARTEGLGIHATLDLAGRVRFGPDTEYVERLDYAVDAGRKAAFHRAVQRYLPAVAEEALSPDMCGIRPKLQGPGEEARDFVVMDEAAAGVPGLIDLIGIESPGLTACIPIARRVAELVRPYCKG
jgi:L-2-hydroxyglutarate oxidase LhgO